MTIGKLLIGVPFNQFDLLFSIVASAALVLDWNASVGWAVFRVSIVESFDGPEGMVLLVEDLLSGKCVLGELKIALEEFSFAGTLSVGRLESASLAGVFPGVLLEFTDALVTVLFSDAFLAVLEGFALVIEAILKEILISEIHKEKSSDQKAHLSIKHSVFTLGAPVPISESGRSPSK